MNVPPLLSGWRWYALVVAGGMILIAAILAPQISTNLSVLGITFTAVLGFIATGLTAFYWYLDRQDRAARVPEDQDRGASRESRREAARKARIRPRLDYEMTSESAGEGHFRNTIWLLNRGPGRAAALELTFDAVNVPDLGTRPLGEIWADPLILAKAQRIGPFHRSDLPVGSTNKVPIFRDSESPSTGEITLPLRSSDVGAYTLIRVKAECSDIDGTPVAAVFDVLQKAGGFDVERSGAKHWVESWRLLS